jgi:hypothetical protein
LLSLYRRHYRTRTPPLHVQERIRGLVDTLRRQYGMPAELPFEGEREAPQQLDLFGTPPPRGRLLPTAEPAWGDEERPAGAA